MLNRLNTQFSELFLQFVEFPLSRNLFPLPTERRGSLRPECRQRMTEGVETISEVVLVITVITECECFVKDTKGTNV